MKKMDDYIITDIMRKIKFRFMNQFTSGTMNSTTDSQANLRGLDLANTEILDEDNPFMQIEFLRTPRMSTISIAYIINKLVRNMPVDQIYLNVGVWCGWSFFAGLIGNDDKTCIGVDNFSEFPEVDSKKIFEHQYNIFKTKNSSFYEMDYLDYFKNVHKGKIGVYFYDGDHSYEHQLKALKVAEPLLAKNAYIIIDDTNDTNPFKATMDFILQNKGKYEVVLERKTAHNSHPTFWNGLLILKKLT